MKCLSRQWAIGARSSVRDKVLRATEHRTGATGFPTFSVAIEKSLS